MSEFRARARELAPKLLAMKLRRTAYHEAGHAIVAAHLGLVVDEVGVEVAARFEAGAVVSGRGRPLARAAVLAAGAEAERRVGGGVALGNEIDEAELDGMAPQVAARGRSEARKLVTSLWPYIEALAEGLVEARHMAGPTAIFFALASVHGAEEARRRERRLRARQAFDLS